MKNNNLLFLSSPGLDRTLWEDSWATGELYRIYIRKDTLGKTVQVNEPIKTDKFTQRKIVVPDVGEVIVNTNSEGKFEGEEEFEQILGELAIILKRLPKTLDYKIRMPQAVCGVRGTQFITKVEKNSTNTLIVLDGEVEFSDRQKKKTVLVKKNQRSVVKPDGLPSEPIPIDPDKILRWWE